jgi:hypothetical protein
MFSKVALERGFVEAGDCTYTTLGTARKRKNRFRGNTIQKPVCHCTMIWPVIFGWTEQ